MSFDNLSDFLAMGGHGLYVWLSYGVGVFVLVANWLAARASQRSTWKQLAQRQRRDQVLERDRIQEKT